MIYLLLSVVVLQANQEIGDSGHANRETAVSTKLEIGGAMAGVASQDGLTQTPEEGLWPSRKFQALLLRRFAADIGAQYEFDEGQQTELEQAVLDRWTPFLASHREQLKPLVNEFLELKMQLEPPPKEEIQAWAKRAMPQFELIRDQLYEGVDDLRDVANELQRVKIDAQALMLGGALTYGETQLALWRDGEFDPADFIAPTRTQRRQQREKRRAKKKTEASKPDAELATDPDAQPAKEAPRDFIEEELSLWDQYVVDFVRRFELDDGQRSSAQSVLAEMKQRAMGHRSQRTQELAALEAQLARENQSPAEQAEIKGQIQDLYGPVDALFAELKRRVDQLPTASQRARAADREKAAGTEQAKKEAVPTQPTATKKQPKKEKESPEPQPPTATKDRESDRDR